jgi:hypothetical protein
VDGHEKMDRSEVKRHHDLAKAETEKHDDMERKNVKPI